MVKKGTARSNVRRLAVDGMLCAAAIVGRIALGALPNVQPVTAILILMAVYIGIWDSTVSAVVITLVTNAYMGLGAWSLYQMAAWAAIAVISGLLFKKHHHPVVMLIWAVFCGFAYGAAVSVFSWNTLSTGTGAGGYAAYWLSGLLFDGYHALGNAVFIWLLQPLFEKLALGKLTQKIQ